MFEVSRAIKFGTHAWLLSVALLGNVSLSAESIEATDTSAAVAGVLIPGPDSMLWNNTQIVATTNGIISLRAVNLPAGADQVNVADDFVVPVGVEWTVNFVYSQGFTNQLTDASSFSVTFYSNNAGVPGAEIASHTIAFGGEVTMATQELALTTPVRLDAGRYWVSVYANYSPFVDLNTTRWNWTTGALANGNAPALLQDTGSFFGSVIPWSPLADVGVANARSTFFALRGTSGVALADVSLQKTAAAPAAPSIGSQVTFTLTVSNAGPAVAADVTVVDQLPSTLSYVANTCGAANTGSTVTWTVGMLANGGSASCDIITTIRDSGTIVNVATASSTSGDPLSANNSSSVTIAGASSGPANIPTLQQMVLILLSLLLAGVAVLAIRR